MCAILVDKVTKPNVVEDVELSQATPYYSYAPILPLLLNDFIIPAPIWRQLEDECCEYDTRRDPHQIAFLLAS